MTTDLPVIGITVGDAAGIGPEIAERTMADARVREVCTTRRFGPGLAEATARFTPGRLSAEAGRLAYDTIVEAVDAARAGEIDAIATAPIHKEAFALADLPWRGHTDLLASLCDVDDVAMLFWSDTLRVVLATVHIPLSEVPRALTTGRLERVLALAARELPAFGLAHPRIAVAGLNPHAGEHGLMGTEDDEVIAPVVAAARARGMDVHGPLPADTVFVRAVRGQFDLVVACYHDQGLVPVKLVAFGQAVNVTLGLPIIRTSVDHGTAFDIAGRGEADPSSMIAAVLLAARLAKGRRARLAG